MAAVPCIEAAWRAHRQELRGFLLKHCGNREDADDLLQSVYAAALHQRRRFCELDTPRAWLFKVARHQWIDRQRRTGRLVFGDVPETSTAAETDTAPVESLAGCIARALPHCSPEDRDIISQCDLEGVKQLDYARRNQLSLAASKARLRRARRRLRERLIGQCEIVFDEQDRICCHLGQQE